VELINELCADKEQQTIYIFAARNHSQVICIHNNCNVL